MQDGKLVSPSRQPSNAFSKKDCNVECRIRAGIDGALDDCGGAGWSWGFAIEGQAICQRLGEAGFALFY